VNRGGCNKEVGVRLPLDIVTLVDCDNIGWKSWKLIAQTIRRTHWVFVAKGHLPTPRKTWGNFWDTRGRVGKSGMPEHKSGNVSESRKDR